MLGSAILDVAIGLIFVYLLLSLICSSCAEGIESIFKQRAKFLEAGIQRMLGDLAGRFFGHALIEPLFSEQDQKGHKPAYIATAEFTAALGDLCRLDFTDALNLKKSIDALADTKVKRALTALYGAAAADVEAFRRGMATWFDHVMSGVGAWYKRRAQFVIFLVGLGIAVLANADTISLARSFSRDKALREAIVQAATEYAKAPPAPEGKPQSPADALARAKANVAELDKLGLPLGWHLHAAADDIRAIPSDAGPILLKLFGVLLTALAISLGAPFWFDLLNKFMVVRSTIKPDEKPRKETARMAG